MGNADIMRFASENWDIGSRQTENYIAEARLLIEKDASLSQAFLAETIASLRQVRVKQHNAASIKSL